jgi:hypothetical protein
MRGGAIMRELCGQRALSMKLRLRGPHNSAVQIRLLPGLFRRLRDGGRPLAAALLLLSLSGGWALSFSRTLANAAPLTCCGNRGKCPMHPEGPCPQSSSYGRCACGLSAPVAPLAPAPLLLAGACPPENGARRVAANTSLRIAPSINRLATHAAAPPRRPPRR